jgi:hypothetical protein
MAENKSGWSVVGIGGIKLIIMVFIRKVNGKNNHFFFFCKERDSRPLRPFRNAWLMGEIWY